jgi:hypothetical protein
MYAKFCYERGYEVKASAKGCYGKLSTYKLRAFDDIFWPEGSAALPICDWKSFRLVWKAKFPLLKIRNPCEDVCGDCVIFRNRFRYLSGGGGRVANDNDDTSGSEDNNSSALDSDSDDADDDLMRDERLISKANEHVVHASAQRRLSQQREREAKEDEDANVPHEEKRFVLFCFVFFSICISFCLLFRLFLFQICSDWQLFSGTRYSSFWQYPARRNVLFLRTQDQSVRARLGW